MISHHKKKTLVKLTTNFMMDLATRTWILVISTMYVDLLYGQNLTDIKSLHSDLFTGHNNEIMPVLDYTKPLTIGVAFYIASFNYFHEVEESISLTAALTLNWTDPSMAWDPALYGNTQYMIINSKKLWLPRIFLVSKIDSMKPVGHNMDSFTTIRSNGEVWYLPGGILVSKCPTDISKFPFDTQTCRLAFSSWGILSSNLILSSVYEKAVLNLFTPHSDWTLQEYTTSDGYEPQSGYHEFHVKISIKRQPLYHVVMVILPTLLFALINPLVFVLPIDSGERVSLSITIMLSYVMFLGLVSSSIPASSNPMSALLIIMVIIIFISGVIVIGTIINTKYFFLQDSKKFGYMLTALVRIIYKKGIVPVNKNQDSTVTGKDIAGALDSLFFYGTYAVILLLFFVYFVYVSA